MKKIVNILYTAVLSVFIASCSLNDYATFEDKDAFAAFDKTSVSVKENGGDVEVSVTLASVAGLSETVTCELVDGTAKKGINYDIVGDGSLTFSKEERTQKLKIKVINNEGVFTGDLRFNVKFSNTGNINEGSANSCEVVIIDLDHPLSSILGKYKIKAPSAFGGEEQFEMEIIKDAVDVTKVWFANIGGIGDKAGFYGVVNSEKTQISVPMGQNSITNDAGSNGDGKLYLYGVTADGNVATEGNMIINIMDGGAKLEFSNLGAGLNAGGAGFYAALIPPYFGTK